MVDKKGIPEKKENEEIEEEKEEYLNSKGQKLTKIYRIVGKDEADIKKNLIYFRSPLGKGLIGKNKNETALVKTPVGEKKFKIREVKYSLSLTSE